MEEQPQEEEEENPASTQVPFGPTHNLTGSTDFFNQTTPSYWLDPTEPSPADREDEFVNAVVAEYEDSNEPGSAMGLPPETHIRPTRLPPVLLELRWLPPRAPTSYDGFNVYIYRDGTRGGGRRRERRERREETGVRRREGEEEEERLRAEPQF